MTNEQKANRLQNAFLGDQSSVPRLELEAYEYGLLRGMSVGFSEALDFVVSGEWQKWVDMKNQDGSPAAGYKAKLANFLEHKMQGHNK